MGMEENHDPLAGSFATIDLFKEKAPNEETDAMEEAQTESAAIPGISPRCSSSHRGLTATKLLDMKQQHQGIDLLQARVDRLLIQAR